MSEPETQYYKHYITCPYCGYEDKDSWEFDMDSGHWECGKCEKEFFVERQISVDYTSCPISDVATEEVTKEG